jgi:TPR repeat protein
MNLWVRFDLLACLSLLFGSQPALAPGVIYKQSLPSVVLIRTYLPDGKGSMQGSGFIVSTDGKIVTNYHVIQCGRQATVTLQNGDAYDNVQVLDVDARKDIALVKIKALDLHPIRLGNSTAVQVGDPVYALGNPMGLTDTLSEGIISGIRQQTGYKVLQVTAPYTHGSSGGPLLNAKGEVIGITSLVFGGGGNLNFAIPIDYARPMILSPGEPKSLATVYNPVPATCGPTTAPALGADLSKAGPSATLTPGPSAVVRSFQRPERSSTRIDLLQGKMVLYVDAERWKQTESTDPVKFLFQHSSGQATAAVVAESVEYTPDGLRQGSLINLRKVASDARVVSEENRRVNGIDVYFRQMDGTLNGVVPSTFYAYYYTGPLGSVQVLTWSARNLLAQNQPDLEGFLNGLAIPSATGRAGADITPPTRMPNALRDHPDTARQPPVQGPFPTLTPGGGLSKDAARAACDGGDATGCANLAGMYVNGLGGLPKDEVRAAALFKQACDGGHVGGCTNLGAMNATGRGGLPKDEARAAALYKQACDGGNAAGCVHLAAIYATGGGGLPKDEARAAALFKRGCNNNAPGCFTFGTMYAIGAAGLPKDEARAVALYKQVCDAGYADGCAHLGFMYATGGGGLPKDGARAAALLKQGCDGGTASGCDGLGVMYATGGGGFPADLERAAALYKQACDGGIASGCGRLGAMYATASGGLLKDLVRAAALYKQACDGGIASGCGRLGAMYATASGGLLKDLVRAAALYKQACDGSNASGCTNLGLMYARGDGGLPRDLARATALYKQGCDGGFVLACDLLGK